VDVARPVPPLVTGKVPVTPVVSGKPVALVRTSVEGVPRFGVVSVGEVPKTNAPLPVSSGTAVIRFALDGVASQAAIPVPSPETPVEIGSPVAFVSVPLAGVPRIGAMSVGPLFRTTVLPVPVVVAALIAVPLPAKTGLLIVVVSVKVGAPAFPSDVPARPFAVATAIVETVPPPEK